jgi:acyl-CoA thioester hydrolase
VAPPEGAEPAALPWDHGSPFVQHFRVSEGDIDALQHTNNTVYVHWCEQVAWAHSAALGLDTAAYLRLDRAMAIIRSEFDYLRASHRDDAVVVGTWITGWDGRLTLYRRFQAIRESDAAVLLRAAMTFACIEISSGRPRRMPREFIDGYGPAILPSGDAGA